MKVLSALTFLFLSMITTTLFDFKSDSDLSNWYIVDDVVMGGRSDGRIEISPEGYGLYTGKISLENNGGFSSLRYRTEPVSVSEGDRIRIRIKGDGKKYQLRVKQDRRNEYSYVHEFESTGDWQVIEVPLSDMYPVYRGRDMNYPNFDHDRIEEVIFLIGNKRPEEFRLLIDHIELISE